MRKNLPVYINMAILVLIVILFFRLVGRQNKVVEELQDGINVNVDNVEQFDNSDNDISPTPQGTQQSAPSEPSAPQQTPPDTTINCTVIRAQGVCI